MSLKSGPYIINSFAAQGPIRRAFAELMDMAPKGIFLLEDEMQPSVVSVPVSGVISTCIESLLSRMQWQILQTDKENSYILCAGGAGTAVIDNKVFAILRESPPPEEWVITRDVQKPNGYM